MVKNQPANAEETGDAGLISESGRSPGDGNSNPLQHSCLENSMDKGAWQATVHEVPKSQTRLRDIKLHEKHCQNNNKKSSNTIFYSKILI